jgi:hypothetical protein
VKFLKSTPEKPGDPALRVEEVLQQQNPRQKGGSPMAIIRQQKLFGWEEIEELGDLERLRLVIEHMPDEELMLVLESERARGRDDYPIRGVWNSVLAGVVCCSSD